MEKYEKLIQKIRERKNLVVAFSGGADSTLVAKACMDAGIKCLAITIISPLMARRWVEDAKRAAEEVGIEHVFVEKGLSEDVVKNDRMRCYYCKKENAILIKKFAFSRGFDTVADGINASDEYIGKIAADEEGIWHPLVETGIKKDDVRKILKEIGVSVWKKYPESCLATRIEHEKITEEKLRKIEDGEEFLLKYVDMVRLRCHLGNARIEVLGHDMEKLLHHRKEIVSYLKKLGFKHITLDMEGYRSVYL